MPPEDPSDPTHPTTPPPTPPSVPPTALPTASVPIPRELASQAVPESPLPARMGDYAIVSLLGRIYVEKFLGKKLGKEEEHHSASANNCSTDINGRPVRLNADNEEVITGSATCVGDNQSAMRAG